VKYFYYTGKPNCLPMDEDRNDISLPLIQCPYCGEKRTPCYRMSPSDPRTTGSPELRRAWRELKNTQADEPLDRWPKYEHFAGLFQKENSQAFVSPGMHFGQIQVRVDQMVDLAAPGLGVMVLKKSSFEELVAVGLHIASWPVKARFSKRIKNPEDIVELVAHPLAKGAEGQGIALCSQCNRSDYRQRQKTLASHPCALSEASVPMDADVFRIQECPTNIIVSERFVEAVKNWDCGNIIWNPVEIGR
jgi:hypothetical protein